MTVSDFIAAVRAEAAQLPFVTQVLLTDQTDYAAKLILTIRPGLFIQMYANAESGTRGYALVFRGQRIYGRDCDAQGWHRHPPHDPLAHDVTPEGRHTVEVGDFFREVRDILEEEGLL